MNTSLLWFRRDLRLDDHPALLAAATGPDGTPRDVLAVFLADDRLLQSSGAPRRNFLAGCLVALSESMGGRLLITGGRAAEVIPALAQAVGADSVHVSADFAPYGRARDERVKQALQAVGVELVATGSPYAVAPGRVRKPDGSAYSVFTPYYRGWLAHGWRKPADPGSGVSFLDPASAEVTALAKPRPADQLSAELPEGTALLEPGEAAAHRTFGDFVESAVVGYDDERDRPDHPGTSRMSAYLKWGCIHPRTLLAGLGEASTEGAQAYRRELGFRDFYADLLFQHPQALTDSGDPAVEGLEYDSGPVAQEHLAAWKAGRTGYPYIDAGLRQLLAEGWIHNRARMGVASFLIKDLHLPWQLGAAHYLEHLVDGDVASNTYGWQWVAGAGAQAAPYYRIFNPIGQGEKHDPTGDYVRKYVPELAGVPGKAVHRPWELPDGIPAGYPDPIVDHATARTEALRRWEQRPR